MSGLVGSYTIKPLSPETWEAFAGLAERHNGVWTPPTTAPKARTTRSCTSQSPGLTYNTPRSTDDLVSRSSCPERQEHRPRRGILEQGPRVRRSAGQPSIPRPEERPRPSPPHRRDRPHPPRPLGRPH